ncbi:MAG: DUF3833 domain-containing protein [Comamonas sp.]|nr:DUF3833 domain-containing protein [Candidatus Comamonas equi]
MNQRRTLLIAGLASVATLAGCAGPQVSDYVQQKPLLELDRYFNGRVLAHGIFQKRDGTVARRFTVVMDCHWEGNQGVLDEHFSYSDGSTERRVWRLTKHADGRYIGQADDVVGEAQGQTSGNAFRWNYTLRLPVDGSVYEVQFDDWMFLMDDRVMLNRATMSKFGIRLGEVLLSFTKV